MSRIPLKDLYSYEYEHPLDRVTLSALKKIPIVPKLIELITIPVNTLERTKVFGSFLRVNERQAPSIYRMLQETCAVLGVDEPLLYIEADPNLNAYTRCSDQPIIVISSGLLDNMENEEIMFVIGHELAHIKSRHLVYHILGVLIGDGLISSLLTAMPGAGAISVEVLSYAYFEWYRASEFTCDRGGLLACQDFNASCKALMKIAGCSLRYMKELDLNEFIEQGRSFQEMDYTALGAVQKIFLSRTMTHPWPVSRVSQLLKFYESTEYTDVIQRNPERKKLGNPEAVAEKPVSMETLTQVGTKALDTTKNIAGNVAKGTKGAISGFAKGLLKMTDGESTESKDD